MKKLLFVITLLFVGICVKAQVLMTSPKGIQYWVSIPTAHGKYPIAFYVPGGGDRPENPQNSTFYKQFMPTNKDKFICAAAVMPPGRTGWDFPVDASGTKAGAYIAKYIFDTYADQSNGKFHGGGWSAGASYNFWYECRSFLTTLTICAGLGDMNTIRAFGQYKIPGRHYHGTSDGAISITKVRYGVDQYGPAMVLIEIPGGSHSSAPALAYSTTENIALWYLSFNPPPDNSGMDYPVKKAYLSTSKNKLVIEFENGITWEYPPPEY